MLYPENIEVKLGFDQIREMVRQYCLSSLGQEYLDSVKFSSDFNLVRKLLDQSSEFLKILNEKLDFPIYNYINAVPLLYKMKPQGAFLQPEEFAAIKVSLKTIFSCLAFFDSKETLFPALSALRKDVPRDKTLLHEIDKVIDDKGAVRSTASPELQEIRRKLQIEQSQIRKELDKILRYSIKQGYTDEELSGTIRNGRMVIPVKAEFKRSLKGFIQDESASGQTVFIEPAEVLEINNAIRDLEYAEQREVIKILDRLSEKARLYIPDLLKAYNYLGVLDFIRAKTMVAMELEARVPEIQDSTLIRLCGARHPLLFLKFKNQGKEAIPLDVRLSATERILVVSGPNAGGKSVALKTIGLLQYMLQCGFPVPVQEGSVMGIFDALFIDIGDEQSVENDLSTYSSHLKNMKHFLFFAGNKSLILIDEFGTGTEPNFGGAIAEAVLEKLNAQKVFGVITTHFANLKAFAENAEGIINGAMLFDMRNLEPLYILEIGRPGSSFALEIASKTGIPKEIMGNARQKAGTEKVDYDKLIKELEQEKGKFRRQTEKLLFKQAELEKSLKSYKEEKDFLETHRKKLMQEAKQQAKGLLSEANKKIEQTIRAIKEQQAEKVKTKALRNDLAEFSQAIEPESVKEPEKEMELEEGAIKVGDAVKIRDQDTFGEVLSLKDKEAEILIGSLKSKIKLKRLQKISRREFRKQVGEASLSGSTRLNLGERLTNFSPNLDLRGMRAEEALSLVDTLIDNALIFGVGEVRIVHGKGNGILRTVIRAHLKSTKEVSQMTDAHADRGGAGVTVVTLS